MKMTWTTSKALVAGVLAAGILGGGAVLAETSAADATGASSGVGTTASACVQWALGDVKAALKTAGVEWDPSRVAVEISQGKDIKAEGFSLAITGDRVKVTGGDATGAMYGLLELAEQIRNGKAQGGWQKIVATLAATRQEPFVQFRANNQFIQNTPHLLLDDVDMWKRYIDLLARSRFNWLDLHGGWVLESYRCPNLYPLLVHVNEYANVGKIEQQQKNLKNLRAIAAYAHDRGIKVAFMNYEAGGGGAPTGKDLADYTAKAVTALLREMPELDMLGFRIGESGQAAGFFQDAYIKGFLASGRTNVTLYTRSWGAKRTDLEKIGLGANGRFDLEIKYNGEQLGLPYQAIHNYVGQWASYSYEDHIRTDNPYRIIWQVRDNGTHRYWAWEDTDFIRRCVGTFPFGDARGFSVESQFSYYPAPAAAYYARPEDQKVYDYIVEKYWFSLMAWGRLSYNPQLPEATFVAALEQHFGPSGRDIYRAMQASGNVVPLVLAYRYQGPDHYDHAPEMETGLAPGRPPHNITKLAEFCPHPMDERNFIGIRDFVANKIAGKSDGRMGPEQVASLFAAAAAETRACNEKIKIPSGHAADEWRLLQTDLLAAAALGEYYAAEIRGVTHMLYAQQTGNETDFQQGTKYFAEALAAWKKLAGTTDPVFAPINNYLRWQKKFHWSDYTKIVETVNADGTAATKKAMDAMPAASSGKALKPPLAFTPSESGQPSGIVVKDVRHTIKPGGTVKIVCSASSAAPVKAVILWWKNLPSTDHWNSVPMTGQGEFSATVPLMPAGLMYQIEIQDDAGAAAIFPPVLKSTPWWMITPQELQAK